MKTAFALAATLVAGAVPASAQLIIQVPQQHDYLAKPAPVRQHKPRAQVSVDDAVKPQPRQATQVTQTSPFTSPAPPRPRRELVAAPRTVLDAPVPPGSLTPIYPTPRWRTDKTPQPLPDRAGLDPAPDTVTTTLK